jgi:hypothetical protein
MILHCEEPMRKKRRNDGLANNHRACYQPSFDAPAYDQPFALTGTVREEVAAEAHAALSPPAQTGSISTHDCERKSILIPSDDAHNLNFQQYCRFSITVRHLQVLPFTIVRATPCRRHPWTFQLWQHLKTPSLKPRTTGILELPNQYYPYQRASLDIRDNGRRYRHSRYRFWNRSL